MSSQLPTERTAVVTGGASPRGIGRATADRLARDGWSVAVLDVDDAGAAGSAAEVAAAVLGFHPRVAADIIGRDVGRRGDRPGRVRPPADRRTGQRRRGRVADGFSTCTPGRMGSGVRRQRAGTFLVTRRVVPAMIAPGRPDRQCVVGVVPSWRRDVYSKVPYSAVQGGRDRVRPGVGAGGRRRTRSRSKRDPGPDRHRHHGWHADRRAQGPGACRYRCCGGLVLSGGGGRADRVPVGADAGYITAATYDINGGLQMS